LAAVIEGIFQGKGFSTKVLKLRKWKSLEINKEAFVNGMG